jgi:hypothetical protein
VYIYVKEIIPEEEICSSMEMDKRIFPPKNDNATIYNAEILIDSSPILQKHLNILSI